ncbi:Uncharacterised protein [Nocardia otitidiscaviarum]|uniref:Uncharacterized protein n=1 Tax=Nocardia otitidiscaviarum TaxID=1823 RepID=A0A379JMI7_9NOCA|nr:Uncharacterised protein [Nocardia otitidiscaviarum]
MFRTQPLRVSADWLFALLSIDVYFGAMRP